MVPDRSAIVQRVFNEKHYDLTTKLGSGRFLEDVVWALHQDNAKFGHLRKTPAQNQWNGHAVDNPLWFEAGRSQAVDIIAASESTNAHLSWAPDQPRAIYDERWYPPTGPDVFRLPPHHTRLGASLFWLMAGFRGYRQQLEANLEWLRDVLKADYIRAFAVVGGDEYQTGSGDRADPWQYAGSFLSWPDYDQVFAGAHDLAASYGLKVAWTLVGGDAQVPSIGQRGAPVQVSTAESQVGLCDRIANLLQGRLDSVELLECWNEYTITGGTREGLRAMAARLRQRLGPQVLIALDTPETAMAAAGEADALPHDTTYLYGGSAANCITPQWARDEPNPRHMGPDAPSTWYSHEPRGPGASAGGDTADPLYLADDYMQSCMVIANGPPQPARGYLFHTKAGVWGGHCHPAWPAENAHANVFDHDPSGVIASALRTVRAGGTVSPGDDLTRPIDPDKPDPPTQTSTDRLLPGESLTPGEQLVSPGKTCQALYDHDGNFVLYTSDGQPVWASETAGKKPGLVQMNPDGNLVIYDAEGTPCWASQTAGNPGAMCQLQDDRALVIYADPTGPNAGQPLWSSATGGHIE